MEGKTTTKEISKVEIISPPVVRLQTVSKEFYHGNRTTQVLYGVDFNINSGDFVIIYGTSGSGKSTILSTILGLENPTTGTVYFMGKSLYNFDEDGRAHIRNKDIGVVFQQPIWVKSLSVIENVVFPLTLAGSSFANTKKATELLRLVGMEQMAHKAPAELSGGEQQRVALARALVGEPHLIVADEPTGNLDTHSADTVMQILQELNQKMKRTIILVTHNLEYLLYATKTIRIQDGRVVEVKDKKAGVK